MTSFLPYKTPALLQMAFPGCVWKGDREGLYLTFDDGPIPGLTEYILEILAQYNVPATFFCVGANIVKHPGIFKQLTKAGHLAGNHTHNHLNGWSCDTATYVRNVEMCSEALGGAGEGRLFRPPYGRITRAQFRALKTRYKIVMWTVLSQDFTPADSAECSLKKTLGAIAPGSVIVFHDNLKAEDKLRFMLPRLIEWCLEQGYRFKTME